MDAAEPIAADDVRRAVDRARVHPHASAVAALAFDVLSRQAEGRLLLAGKKLAETRARAAGVDPEQARCDGVDLLGVIERGPRSRAERALLSAFAVLGLGAKLEAAKGAERREILARFVQHADWLETASPYAVYPFVPSLLDDAQADATWKAVGDALVAAQETTPAARARDAARLSALSLAGTDASRRECERVARDALDPVLRALAAGLLGGAPAAAPRGTSHLAGRLGYVPRASLGHAVMFVTGLAAIAWLLRLVGRVIGLSREVEIDLGERSLRIHKRTAILGRSIRESEEVHALSAIAGAARRVRYPALHLVVGLLATAIGILVGGLLFFDGVWAGEAVLALYGAVAVIVGAGLDLGLSILWPARKGRVAFELCFASRRTLRLARVPAEDAERFLSALERRIGRAEAAGVTAAAAQGG